MPEVDANCVDLFLYRKKEQLLVLAGERKPKNSQTGKQMGKLGALKYLLVFVALIPSFICFIPFIIFKRPNEILLLVMACVFLSFGIDFALSANNTLYESFIALLESYSEYPVFWLVKVAALGLALLLKISKTASKNRGS